MKIRYGFVSNSSSSSFVMVGCEATYEELHRLQEKLLGRPKKDEDDYEWEDEAYDAMRNNGWLYDGERKHMILGKVLAEQNDSYHLDDAEYTIQEVNEISKEIEEFFGRKSKLFMGTRAC